MKPDISEAKRKLPLPTLMYRLGLGEHAKKSARCPFHDDKHNSFSVWKNCDGLWAWKCHTGCGVGDEITFLELHEKLLRREAIKRFSDLAGVNGCAPFVPNPNESQQQPQKPFDWRVCVEAFTEKHVERLAKWRGYSTGFCAWLKENRLVGLYDGCIALPVQDRAGNVAAVHYRLKDGSWRYFPQGAKVRPLVIGELIAGEPVHVFESQWDCFAFLDVSGERMGVIVTGGASNGALVADVLPKRATVYVWPQNDAPGEKWQRDVCSHTKSAVKSAKTPSQFADLNDWTRGGATSDDLLQAMIGAEILREAELSWTDALNAAVVTSSELHDLELVPRKKLLGDWFCEGDLGFIFAFRGVGKTWLALLTGQALSTGGKLGGWKTLAPVKVLYVDGEMPPDLMRARCEGLQASNANLEFLNHEILFDRTGKTLNITSPEVQQAITVRCVNSHAKV